MVIIWRKPESGYVRGICVACKIRPQMPKGQRKYRPECRQCHDARYGMVDKRLGIDARRLARPSKGTACEICGVVPGSTLCLDHNHQTGLFRGWLCRACNVGLGHYRDSPELLRKAAAYIEKPRPEMNKASTALQKDHFIVKDGIPYAGTHIIADFWDARGLDDRELLELTLIDAAKAAGATLLHIHLHVFGDGGGISGVAVLAESHISVHTWPERHYAAFDIFMCGDADPGLALAVLKDVLKPARVVTGAHKRGMTT